MLYPIESRRFRGPDRLDAPPAFGKGARVRIKGKPGRERAILAVEWHGHRHCYCYRVETSTSDAGEHDPSYWFAEQIES